MDTHAPLSRCGDCPFRHRCVVLGDGPRETEWVIVGQAPADTEVLQGKPFVGSAGARLNQALLAARVDRSAGYITNTILCQPPGDASPPPPEAVLACHDRLIKEIQLTDLTPGNRST
jgi:uracil-DNA glycosylase family 4